MLLAASLLVALFVVDLRTGRELVPAIAYAVPIALSSLAHSSRTTLILILLAIFATVGVGLETLVTVGFDGVALINRVLALLSFTLVGGFVLVLGHWG